MSPNRLFVFLLVPSLALGPALGAWGGPQAPPASPEIPIFGVGTLVSYNDPNLLHGDETYLVRLQNFRRNDAKR